MIPPFPATIAFQRAGKFLAGAWLLGLIWFPSGCSKRETRVERGNREQILHRGNGTEPQDVDPHTVTGVPEHHIISALIEGLVAEDPVDLHPVPGVAERWDVSDDGRIYTFHLRPDAKWSNGERVTAQDFVSSFQRMLAPTLASEYAYMLFVMKNAERYNKGELKDFHQVGCQAIDESTLRIELSAPTPYFLSLLNHYSWFPVPVKVIARHGPLDLRGNRWTRPENFVGNGPFMLSEWKVQHRLVVKKSPTYWDREKVRLNEIHFHPIESQDTEERAFRAGQLHVTYEAPLSKIDAYRQKAPHLIRIDPYLGTYFYRVNTTRPALKDKRVRRALALALERELIASGIRRGGEKPAFALTPPGTAGYTARAKVPTDIAAARALLAEAGYPDGKNFPRIEILFNTMESHKAIAEAVQQMWKKNLNIDVQLVNQEWKVYIDSTRRLNYDLARYGWIGDYPDPNTFLDMFVTGGGNNQTGWSNAEYDRLIAAAGSTGDMQNRFDHLQQAEAILLDECPIIPIFHYVHPYLLQPSVKGWHPTIVDHHPFKHVYLEPGPAVAP